MNMCFVLEENRTFNYISVHFIHCAVKVVTMAQIQFLTILLVATYFLGGVVSVTDKEFEVFSECILLVVLLSICDKQLEVDLCNEHIVYCYLFPWANDRGTMTASNCWQLNGLIWSLSKELTLSIR